MIVKLTDELGEEIKEFVRKKYMLTDVRYINNYGIVGICDMGYGGVPFIIKLTYSDLVGAVQKEDFREAIGKLDSVTIPYKSAEECKKDFIRLVSVF